MMFARLLGIDVPRIKRHGGIAVAVHAAAFFHPLGRVALYRQADSRQRRQ